jgi:hypothetical protein
MGYRSPAVVNAVAEDPPVILFENTDLGESCGKTPDNVAQIAAEVEILTSSQPGIRSSLKVQTSG